jgi:hypothetical protein
MDESAVAIRLERQRERQRREMYIDSGFSSS